MISSLKFNRLQLGDRKKLFDKYSFGSQSNYRHFEDHTKMKGHEFAAFQKRLFQQMKKDKKRRRIVLLVSCIITLFIIFGFLIFWSMYDFSVLKSSEF